MRTILDEVLQESSLSSSCSSGHCKCHSCAHQQQEQEIVQEVQKLGLGLTSEEEQELGKAIAKIKDLAKKGKAKVKRVITIADIIRRLITPGVPDPGDRPVLPPPPEMVHKDLARYYEEEKRRRREALIEQARQATKNKGVQKPDKEMSVMGELLTEMEVGTRPTIRYGATGANVVYLQYRLNYHDASIVPLKEDGIWGPKTQGAVLKFQKEKGLVVDGIVGPKTWAALDTDRTPKVTPKSCAVREREFELEFEAPAPPPPVAPRIKARPCCMLSPSPTSFAGINNLGTHNTSTEVLGQIYTGQAGFIDLGHVRELCDLTKHVYDQLVASNYNTPIATIHGKADMLKCPVDVLKTAMAIAYEDSVGYEIFTYGLPAPGGHNSSFSPEDLCSNNLGTIIAEKAILSIQANPSKTFDGEVTAILSQTLVSLDAQSLAETQKAFDKIKKRWVDYSYAGSPASGTYLKRRNFSHIPWKAGHSSDKPTPSWLTAGLSQYSHLFDYTHTLIKTIRKHDFSKEIRQIRIDAQTKYGTDYDKP
jgi:hypothetical protein